MTIDPREVARWARIVTANRLICVRADTWMNCGDGGTHHGGADFCTPIGRLAEAFEDTHKDNRMDLLTTSDAPRQCAIPLLVELCAGTAALSLRLERAGARPPVSRMGAKTGYSDAILALAGLNPGDRAEHYLWCEPDDGVRLLLHAYRDADLAREAARIIRSWADEEPRALWERLRAEGPARCPPVDAREVGRWAWVINRTLHSGFKGDQAATSKRAQSREAVKARRAELSHAIAVARSAAGLSRADVSEAVVGTRSGACWNWENGQPVSAAMWPVLRDLLGLHTWDDVVLAPAVAIEVPIDDVKDWTKTVPTPDLENATGLPATIHDDARTAPVPVPVPPGTLVYMDGPYENTTGYSHLFPRGEQVEVARRWDSAGARVMISEAVPIEELTAEGWHAVEVTAMRVGQKRTFSRQQREWVTMNFQPDARAVRACEIATERADRTERVMAGGEQIGLFRGDR